MSCRLSCRRTCIPQGHVGLAVAVLERDVVALDGEGELLGALADFFRGGFHPIGQDVAESPAVNDLLDQSQHGIRFAELQRPAASVFFAQNPVLQAFHGKGCNVAHGHAVQSVKVAELVGPGHGWQVVVAPIIESKAAIVWHSGPPRLGFRGYLGSPGPCGACTSPRSSSKVPEECRMYA